MIYLLLHLQPFPLLASKLDSMASLDNWLAMRLTDSRRLEGDWKEGGKEEGTYFLIFPAPVSVALAVALGSSH